MEPRRATPVGTPWSPPTSALADAHGGAVGADLGPRAAELARVEAEGDDRVGALGLGLLDEPLLRVLATLDQHLRHAAQLAADQRLEPGADLRPDVPGADR